MYNIVSGDIRKSVIAEDETGCRECAKDVQGCAKDVQGCAKDVQRMCKRYAEDVR